ncbi:hypothetical protein [Methylobacterium aquaticum]|uniref:Recombinase RecT n=1 Tax=Methylobacterium aquaticum TaxID=270351 RepID=A0A0C6EWF9_9HYPH|nr:hypothetical protein [Methylobacterium aquaticum]BAQ44361.1 hypothetical protein Maq22A_c04770 [Methylobacterium aquaticum]
MSAGALTLSATEQKIAERINPQDTANLSVSVGGGVAFANAAQLMDFAKLMALSSAGVRKHLRGNVGACLAIATQAAEWGMSPYAVANKSYFVNDQIAYESQLVQAVILKRAPIKGRIRFEFEGEGDARICIASARLRDEDGGDVVEYRSPPYGKITPKNSPLWKSDPDQQQSYYAGRALCRRHFPDVLLGVYDVEEVQAVQTVPGGAFEVVGTAPAPTALAGRLDQLAARPAPAPARAERPVAAEPMLEDDHGEDDIVDQDDDVGGSGDRHDPGPDRDEAGAGGDGFPGDDALAALGDAPRVDPNDEDFKRGVTAAKRGAKKCLNPDITADPDRMAAWKAGFDSVEA